MSDGVYQVRKVYSNALMRTVEEFVLIDVVDVDVDSIPAAEVAGEPEPETAKQPKAKGKANGKRKSKKKSNA